MFGGVIEIHHFLPRRQILGQELPVIARAIGDFDQPQLRRLPERVFHFRDQLALQVLLLRLGHAGRAHCAQTLAVLAGPRVCLPSCRLCSRRASRCPSFIGAITPSSDTASTAAPATAASRARNRLSHSLRRASHFSLSPLGNRSKLLRDGLIPPSSRNNFVSTNHAASVSRCFFAVRGGPTPNRFIETPTYP